jgi:hypothetical protein
MYVNKRLPIVAVRLRLLFLRLLVCNCKSVRDELYPR